MKDNILAAIDVGSSKVCTLVAEVTAEEELRILGVGITPSQGVKKGMVDNIQQATEAIASSVERAERSSGSRIVSAHVSIGGNHANSLNNRGIATIPGKQRPITEEDIDRAMEGAKSLSLPTNREVLHAIPRYFIVDGQEHVSDPVGMFGQRLDMDTHIVTGSVTAIQNLSQCVEGAGVQVEALVFAPLALILLLFPTGAPQSPRWRPLLFAVPVATLSALFLFAFVHFDKWLQYVKVDRFFQYLQVNHLFV